MRWVLNHVEDGDIGRPVLWEHRTPWEMCETLSASLRPGRVRKQGERQRPKARLATKGG